jgi:hypothetical protein
VPALEYCYVRQVSTNMLENVLSSSRKYSEEVHGLHRQDNLGDGCTEVDSE